MALTAKSLPGKLKQPGRHFDEHGLYLQVVSPTNASWVLRYERNGLARMMGLGPVHLVPLKLARERARAARLRLLDGIDPLEAKAEAKKAAALAAAKAITFEEAARSYFDQHKSKWKNPKHRAQFISTLETYAFPKIGKLSVATIDVGLVLSVLEQKHRDYPTRRLWEAIPETASRLRGRIESVLDWATVRGYRSGANPAKWNGNLAEVLPGREETQKTVHHPALPYTQIGEFLAELCERQGVAARALEFTILCASRTSEVIGARRAEFDLKAKTWTIPENRIKGEREHRVPLSDAAVAILKGLPIEESNPFMFIGPASGVGLSNMAMATVIRRMNEARTKRGLPSFVDPKQDDREITVHGFRSTFRDWAGDMTAYPNHVVEMALAHIIGNDVEAAYRRSDLFAKRVRLMSDWARYCGTRPSTKVDVVVPLRGGQ
jgi:integrase